MDQYGNYFCQKLFTKINDEQKQRLAKTLLHTIKFMNVACNSKGTHALQSFLEFLAKPTLI